MGQIESERFSKAWIATLLSLVKFPQINSGHTYRFLVKTCSTGLSHLLGDGELWKLNKLNEEVQQGCLKAVHVVFLIFR